MSILIGLSVGLIVIISIGGVDLFTDRDLMVIEYLNGRLFPSGILFVSKNQDLRLARRMKELSKGRLFVSVIGPNFLDSIITKPDSQLRFLNSRTMIVTKDALKLTEILSKVQVSKLLIWVIFHDYNDYEKDLYIPMSNNIFFVQSTGENITISQAYHLKPDTKTQTVKVIESWKADEEIGSRDPDSFEVMKKDDFQNITLSMVYLQSDESCKNLSEMTLASRIECFHGDLLKIIGKFMNFSLTGIEQLDKENAYLLDNKSISNLFSKIKNREVNFSAGSLIMRPFRLGTFDYAWPTFTLKSMMYMKQAELKGNWNLFLRPLDDSLWWAILYWMIFSAIVLLLFEKILLNKFKFDFTLLIDCIKSILRSLQILCNQSVIDLPSNTSIRIVHFVKLIVVMIFFNAYSGYLVSSLTVIIPYLPFTNLEGFLAEPDYKMMTLGKGFDKYYYRKVARKDQRKNHMLKDDDLPKTVQEGIDRICSDEYLTYVGYKEELREVKHKCNIIEIPTPMSHQHLAIELNKNSPYTEYVNRALLYIRSTGLIQRMRKNFSVQFKPHEKFQNPYPSVDIKQVFSIFVLLGMAIVSSIFLLFLEIGFKIMTCSSPPPDEIRRPFHEINSIKCPRRISVE